MKTKYWMKQVLANDEVSSDEELLELFVKEGCLSRNEASRWLALHPQYMLEVFCDAEPDEVIVEDQSNELPMFKGYTVDMRLREFREVMSREKLKFVPFDSPEGKKLFQELKAFI